MDIPTIVPESRHEVWHQSDKGDWRVAYMDVPLPSPFDLDKFKDRVETCYREMVTKWREMLANENEVPVTRAFLNPNVFMVPLPDMEDYRRFYMACRVKKTKPEVLPIDTVDWLRKNDVSTDDAARGFFEAMSGFRG